MSDRDTILQDLKNAGEIGVCTNEWLHKFIARSGARVHELRSDGWLIDSEKCRVHAHKGNVARYFLRGQYRHGHLSIPEGEFEVLPVEAESVT